jgi:ABC-2 type transport system permease protein/sodium transport system permease protein
LLAQLGRVFRLARKELREILRDRRTVITMVVMPLLLYVLLGIAFRQFFLSNLVAPTAPQYRIGFNSEPVAQLLLYYFRLPVASAGPDVAVADYRSEPSVVPRVENDLEAAVRHAQVHLGIRLRNPLPADRGFDPDLVLDCELLYLEGSVVGMNALAYVESRCAAANLRFLERQLQQLSIRPRPVPVKLERTPLRDTEDNTKSIIAGLVPLVLILMTITGAVYPAIDLTAGERERGTLEILVAAPIPRLGLLFAKYVAVVCVALLTALVNLVSMMLTLQLSGLAEQIFPGHRLTVLAIVEVFGLLVLFAAFFSAVLLILTSFARSFKEAQAYLVPLMLVSLVPGMLGIVPEISLESLPGVAFVPLLNIVLLARDLLDGTANLYAAATVVFLTLLYALAAVAVAAHIFGAEAVLYSERGSWRNLFRFKRRRDPGEPPGLSRRA